MLLSICIPTLDDRQALFDRLMNILRPQLQERVEICSICSHRRKGQRYVDHGAKRNRLMNMALGEYVCFIDDDDTVPDYYVSEILNAIESKPDCVGFWNEVFLTPNSPSMLAKHSLSIKSWSKDTTYYYRTIGHLNPVKKKIMVQVPFSEKEGSGEDHIQSMALQSLLKTEVFIDRVMYHYYPYTAWNK